MMKKTFFVIIVILGFGLSCKLIAQDYKYKIEYRVRVYESDDSHAPSVSLNFGSLNFGASGPNPNNDFIIYERDYVMSLSNPVTSYSSGSSGLNGFVSQTYQYNNSCGLTRYWSEAPSIRATYFNAVYLDSIQSLNSSLIGNDLKTCEPVRITVSNCVLSYSVQYTYTPSDASSWRTYMGYERRSGVFELDYTSLAEQQINNTLFLRIKYDRKSDATATFSDELQLNFVPCSINYSGLEKEDVSCHSANDGDVTLLFAEDVTPGYEMRYYVIQGDASNFADEKLYDSDLELNDSDLESYGEYRFSEPSADNPNGLGPLVSNEDGTEYRGSVLNVLDGANILENPPANLANEQSYFIVYQEVNYNVSPVEVKSANKTETFIIKQPSAIVIDQVTVTDLQCSNDLSTVTISASGGGYYPQVNSSTYYYRIQGFNPTWSNRNIFTDVPPGEYTVQVATDNTGQCYIEETLNIVAPQELLVNLTTTAESSPNQADGSVIINLSGGETPYAIGLDGASPARIPSNTLTINNLAEGLHVLEVVDNLGCRRTVDFTISSTALPEIRLETDDIISAVCEPADSGSVLFALGGGVAPYNYRVLDANADIVNNGSSINSEEIYVGNLVAGTYTIQAVNQGNDFSNPNLISSAEFTIDSGANIAISNVATTAINCFGDTSTLTFDTNLGATAEYYLGTQVNPDLTTVTWTGYDAAGQSGLTAGTYYLWVRSTTDTSCVERYDEGVIQIVSPTALAYTPTVIDNTEEGGMVGQIDLGPITGGTAPYTITWVSGPAGFDPVTAGNSPVIAGLSSGIYTVMVSDVNGCEMAMDIEVQDPILRIVGTAVLDERCFGAGDGSIQVNYTGLGMVTLAYTGPESGSFDGTGQNSLVLQDLAPGEYTLTLSNDRGEADQTATVTVGGSPSLFQLAGNYTVSPVSCVGAADGVLTLTLTGGWGDYQYSLDGAANASSKGGTLTFTNLSVGIHSLFVTDRATNGCSYAIDFEVDEPEQIAATASVVGLSSFGANDGTIRITEITGGTLNGADTYQLAWSGVGAVTTTDNGWTAIDLAQGNYSVRITDSNGCFETFDYVVIEPGELAATLTADGEVSCYGEQTVSLISTIVGGTPGYAYQWYQEEGGSYTEIAEATEADLFDIGAGNYRLEVTDRDGAGVSATAELTIAQPEALTIALEGITDIECNGASSGGATVSVNGGTGNYEYAWYDAGFNVVATTPNLVNAPSGTYSLEVVDGNSCFTTLTDITLVDLFAPLEISEATVTDVSAYQGTDGGIGITVVGGRPDYGISWEDQTGAIVGNSTNITNIMAGSYTVTITDSNGCEVREVYEVTQPDIIEATINHPRCFGNTDGSISLEVNKGNGSFTYQWNTGATTANLTGLSAGFYTVTISGFASGTETRTYELVNPPLLTVDLGQDVVLCRDQGVSYDISTTTEGATYQWTSDTGFSSSSPIVDLDQAGTYTATVSTPLGCTASGTVTVTTVAQDISAELALSTQAFTDESIMAVDISYPLPDRIEWILPEGAELLEQDQDQVAFLFQEPGEYEIGMVTYRGSCTASQYKTILVLEKDQTVSGAGTDGYQKRVDEFLAYPNPTTGQFTVEVGLTEVANVSVKVFNLSNNRIIAAGKEGGQEHYRMAMDISREPAGIYAVLIETPYGKYLRKVIKT